MVDTWAGAWGPWTVQGSVLWSLFFTPSPSHRLGRVAGWRPAAMMPACFCRERSTALKDVGRQSAEVSGLAAPFHSKGLDTYVIAGAATADR
jgi:hypothetical protein